jgi:hypothetical protein
MDKRDDFVATFNVFLVEVNCISRY